MLKETIFRVEDPLFARIVSTLMVRGKFRAVRLIRRLQATIEASGGYPNGFAPLIASLNALPSHEAQIVLNQTCDDGVSGENLSLAVRKLQDLTLFEGLEAAVTYEVTRHDIGTIINYIDVDVFDGPDKRDFDNIKEYLKLRHVDMGKGVRPRNVIMNWLYLDEHATFGELTSKNVFVKKAGPPVCLSVGFAHFHSCDRLMSRTKPSEGNLCDVLANHRAAAAISARSVAHN